MMSAILNNIFELLDKVGQTEAVDGFTMPGSFYCSEELLQLEREQLFRRKWICLGREEEIPAIGDYFATDLVGEPVLIIRTSTGAVKALSNVCRHRGMPLLDGSGNCKRITCSYHAWTYDLDGDLIRAAGVDDRHADFSRVPTHLRCWQRSTTKALSGISTGTLRATSVAPEAPGRLRQSH
ncbi:MAG: Rieske (2Fe-2S) protein [Gammaproteobacteria bacterium]|nr:Rieske (2Fe-2S) protein [Gammaproteobacteria bacterium]